MTTLTILSENTVRGAGLLGEHGLAYWIDTGTHRVLFGIRTPRAGSAADGLWPLHGGQCHPSVVE